MTSEPLIFVCSIAGWVMAQTCTRWTVEGGVGVAAASGHWAVVTRGCYEAMRKLSEEQDRSLFGAVFGKPGAR